MDFRNHLTISWGILQKFAGKSEAAPPNAGGLRQGCREGKPPRTHANRRILPNGFPDFDSARGEW